MGGGHGLLPWQAQLEVAMAITWHSIGTALALLHGWRPWTSSMASSAGGRHGHHMAFHWHCFGTLAWVEAMDFFHGKLSWRSPWPSHGIPLALLWHSCMGGGHGLLPWQAQLEVAMAITWHSIGT